MDSVGYGWGYVGYTVNTSVMKSITIGVIFPTLLRDRQLPLLALSGQGLL
jgi:hypothetical protein